MSTWLPWLIKLTCLKIEHLSKQHYLNTYTIIIFPKNYPLIQEVNQLLLCYVILLIGKPPALF